MPSFTTVLASLAGSMAVANAAPASNVARQHHTDCSAGSSYYQCGNNKGCFTKDPCVQASTPTILPGTSDSTEGKCSLESGAKTRHNPSAIYDIFPQHPALYKDAVSAVHLESYDDVSQVEQIVVFRDIPAGAKDCSVSWSQGERLQRLFIVKGDDALSTVRQLSGFPKDGEDVSYDSIMPFDNAENNVGGPDFTNWDDREESSHDIGEVECAETLYFKVSLRNNDKDAMVLLQQDESNGYSLLYSC